MIDSFPPGQDPEDRAPVYIVTSLLGTGAVFVLTMTIVFSRGPNPHFSSRARHAADRDDTLPIIAASSTEHHSETPGSIFAPPSASRPAMGAVSDPLRASSYASARQAAVIDSPSPADESAQSVADGFGTFIRKARIDRTSLIRSGGAQGAADASDLRDAPAGISAAAESTRAKFPALGIESIRGAPSPKSIAAYAPVNPGPGLAAGGAVLVPASRAQAQRPASLAGRLTGWFRGNGASGELETGSKGVRATNVPGLGGGGELERSVYSKGATLDLMGVPGGGPETRLSQLRQGETLTLKGETKDGWVKVQTQRLSELNKSTGKWEPTEGWVKKEAVSDDAGLASLLQSPPANQTRQAFVDAVKRYEGTPYRYGGTSPGRDGGVDCSGLVVAGLTDTGFNRIPRTAADQQRASARIDASQLKPGDLVFDGDPAHHVIIVIDGGQAIEAPQTGMTVSRSSLSQRISSMRDPHPASLLP